MSRSRSPQKNKGGAGVGFQLGLDKSILNQEEIDKLLKITSEKSLAAIAKETEMLAGEGMTGQGNMISGADKVTRDEI